LSFQTGETHIVHHLKFTQWPDHGVPHCSEQLVRFIRYMRAVHHKGPITVHCSAGIGRTGVLICTDIIINLIEKDLPVSGRQSVMLTNKFTISLGHSFVKEIAIQTQYLNTYHVRLCPTDRNVQYICHAA